MAWPLTPLTTYLPGGLPAIKAADLNAIQNAINRAFLGTYSYAGLFLDGAGGNPVTLPAGGITATGSASIGGNLYVGAGASISIGLNVGSDISAGGQLALGSRKIGNSLPTPAIAKGVLYGDSMVVAFASIGGDGSLRAGFGIQAIKWWSPGATYDITLQLGSNNYQTLIPIACGGGSGAGVLAQASGTSGNTVRVVTYEITYSTSNSFPMDFNLVVFAQ